jgi:hypothetical protein
MTCKGRVKNGVVILDEPSSLPEGAEVRVEAIEEADEYTKFRDRLLGFAGIMEDMPPDMARNHDHYLYGTAKK